MRWVSDLERLLAVLLPYIYGVAVSAEAVGVGFVASPCESFAL